MVKNKQNTIHYLRHGESVANKNGFLAGQLDVPLTAKGIKQAETAGDKFNERGVHFDTIITSTLERAQHTAHIIRDRTASNRNLQSQLIALPELAERNGGAFQGHSIDAFYAADDDALQAAGGESIRDFVDRARRVNEVIRRIAVGNTLVVGHAELYRAMQLVSRGLPLEAFDGIDKPANAIPLEFPSIPLGHPERTPRVKTLISRLDGETLPLEQLAREMTYVSAFNLPPPSHNASKHRAINVIPRTAPAGSTYCQTVSWFHELACLGSADRTSGSEIKPDSLIMRDGQSVGSERPCRYVQQASQIHDSADRNHVLHVFQYKTPLKTPVHAQYS